MDPIKVAFVGVGRRAREVYFRFLPKLRELFHLVAVCDPLPAAADEAGEQLDVPAFHSVAELVRARPMEAVIYATPFETHHAISLYLSRHGLHHVCETPMAARTLSAPSVRAASHSRNVLSTPAEKATTTLPQVRRISPHADSLS